MIVLEVDMKKLFIVLCLIFVVSGCEKTSKNVLSRKTVVVVDEKMQEIDEIKEKVFPEEKVLEVPFVMQAPFANWEQHNESCEEAGLLLAHYFYTGEVLTKNQANIEILDMVDFQHKIYGAEHDIFAEEMGVLAKDYYGYENYRVIDGTIENIKNEILNNNPVIVPTTAGYLKAEKSDYPEMGYHVVVIVGYNRYGFVTHDVGTVTGEGFTYTFSTLQYSIKDYNSEVLVLK